MNKIFKFLLRSGHFLLLLLYLLIGVFFLNYGGGVQRSYFFNLSSRLTGFVDEGISGVATYFTLDGQNEELKNRLVYQLHQEMLLREEIANLKLHMRDDVLIRVDSQRVGVIGAKVVINSINRAHNFFTLNKGAKQGVERDMGVIDQNGVLGVVAQVSDNYSLAISLLNPDLRLSCRIKSSNYFGSLVWRGDDVRYATLEELPRHAEYVIGDTIVTSGFSSIFSEGLMVGVVEKAFAQKNNNYYALSVKLSADFGRLRDVMLIKMNNSERRVLEQAEIERTKK